VNNFITTIERGDLFEILCHEAAACHVCPRLADHKAAMGRRSGTLIPKVLFVGEAPGRLGADRTRRPFTGDQSGARFDELMASIDLSRDEIFITNAVLCCPADDDQNLSPTVPRSATAADSCARRSTCSPRQWWRRWGRWPCGRSAD